MKEFNFSMEQNVIFGVGAIKKIPMLLKKKYGSKVFIISGPNLAKIGIVDKLTNLLRANSIEFETFLDVESNPTIETVSKATNCYKNFEAPCIVALGGGSPMDVAKAVGVLATHEGNISDYEGYEKIPNDIIPIIAIPTTAGTGSEVTRTTVITDNIRNYKFAVISSKLIPKHSILDPELLALLPESVASYTSMDALVHAIEAYISLQSNIFTDTMAEKALELIGKYIKPFVANRKDIEAASAMLVASNFAGIAFTRALLGNVHAMAHPLGGFFNIPHGLANAVLLPTVMEYNSLADKGKFEKIYSLLKSNSIIETSFSSNILVKELKKLNTSFAIPKTLKDLGASEDKIVEMSIDAMKSGNISANPRNTSQKDVEMLYRKAFSEHEYELLGNL